MSIEELWNATLSGTSMEVVTPFGPRRITIFVAGVDLRNGEIEIMPQTEQDREALCTFFRANNEGQSTPIKIYDGRTFKYIHPKAHQ